MGCGALIASRTRLRAASRLAAYLAAAGLLVGPFAPLDSAEGAGPWRAQVLDAETGQPLEGVVIVALWEKYTTSPAGWAGGRTIAVEEAVTGPDGRFEIPAKTLINWLPILTEIRGPEFVIVKPGYGYWTIVRPEAKPNRPREELRYPAEVLAEQGAVIAMPPLKTQEERLKFFGGSSWRRLPGDIPADRIKRFLELEDREGQYLGFKPVQRREK